uniref:Ig-like domain-containing protein n=1 Tax=Erpetoichthys calabaricus TaxID=27687 RepID=A0A8C4RQ82_ERPCA
MNAWIRRGCNLKVVQDPHWCISLSNYELFLVVVTDSHTLEFIFTAISSSEDLPEFMSAVILDGQQISYYDSKSRQISHKQTRVKQKMYHVKLKLFLFPFTGIHVLQRSLGCDVENGVLKQGFLLYGYNGEDLIGFSKDRLQWFPAIPEAYFLKSEWDKDRMIEKVIGLDAGRGSLLTTENNTLGVRLTCLATGFNHQNIKSSWYRNGALLWNKSQSAKILPNGDGTFQIRDTLEIDHADNNNYSCEVERSTVEFGKKFKLKLIFVKGWPFFFSPLLLYPRNRPFEV